MMLSSQRCDPPVPLHSTYFGLDQLPALVMLDAAGRTLFSTPAARMLCDQYQLGVTATPGHTSTMMKSAFTRRGLRAGMGHFTSVDGVEVSIVSCVGATCRAHASDPHYIVFISPAAMARDRHLRDSLDRLTPAECRVADLVGAGFRNKQIAATLRISCRTVESHLNKIFQKLGMIGRAQLVRFMLGLRAEQFMGGRHER